MRRFLLIFAPLTAVVAAAATAVAILQPAGETLAFADAKLKPLPNLCSLATTTPFVPTHVDLEGVGEDIRVLALGRDANNVPGTPPVSDRVDVAWDAEGIKPGGTLGSVILNAHTWPDNSALGNAMLAHFHEGSVLRLYNDEGASLCYRTTEQRHIPVDNIPPGFEAEFYDTSHPTRVAFMVCSGIRRGPGDWDHREVWFGEPIS